MSDSYETTDLVPFEDMLPEAVAKLPKLYTKGVRFYVKLLVDGLDDAEVDAFIRERLSKWHFRKPFTRFYLKFVEQPGGLRERLAQALGALSLTDDGRPDFAERLWRVSRLVDDLDRDSMSSLYVFAVRYSETVEQTEHSLRRLEYLPGGHVGAAGLDRPADGHRYYQIVPVKESTEADWDENAASGWIQLEDRMVDVLASQLGTRYTGLDTARAAAAPFPGGSGLCRFTSAADETVRLVRRLLALVEMDSLIW